MDTLPCWYFSKNCLLCPSVKKNRFLLRYLDAAYIFPLWHKIQNVSLFLTGVVFLFAIGCDSLTPCHPFFSLISAEIPRYQLWPAWPCILQKTWDAGWSSSQTFLSQNQTEPGHGLTLWITGKEENFLRECLGWGVQWFKEILLKALKKKAQILILYVQHSRVLWCLVFF